MSKFTFKKDSSQASSFKPVPPGKYEVFITKAVHQKAQNTGTDGVNMELTIRDDVKQPEQGRKVFHTLWINENTQGMVHGFLDALGMEDGTEIGAEAESFEDVCNEIADYALARAVKINTKVEEYNGNEYSRVSWFEKSDKGGFHDAEAEAENEEIYVDISGDDLPF